MFRVCFVCSGNICRSPLAAGVFAHLAAQAGRAEAFHIESAGLGAWHVGEPPDRRAQQTAQAHGVTLTGRARQLRGGDFQRFDLLLAVDEEVYGGLLARAPNAAEQHKVRYLRGFDPQAGGDLEVPDPYYGDRADFERVYQLVERAGRGLLAALTAAP